MGTTLSGGMSLSRGVHISGSLGGGGGGGGPSPTGHIYWRMKINTLGVWDTVDLLDFQMYSTIGGPNVIGGGTPFGETNDAFPEFAFDSGTGSAATYWYVTDTTFTNNGGVAYIGYQFATPKDIVQIGLNAGTWSGGQPQAFDIQYSDNGIDYTTAWSVNYTTYADNTFYKFDINNNVNTSAASDPQPGAQDGQPQIGNRLLSRSTLLSTIYPIGTLFQPGIWTDPYDVYGFAIGNPDTSGGPDTGWKLEFGVTGSNTVGDLIDQWNTVRDYQGGDGLGPYTGGYTIANWATLSLVDPTSGNPVTSNGYLKVNFVDSNGGANVAYTLDWGLQEMVGPYLMSFNRHGVANAFFQNP